MDSKFNSLKIAYFAGTMKPEQDGVTRVLFRLIDWLNSNNIENIFVSPIIPEPSKQATRFIQVPSVQFPLYKDYKFALPGLKNFEESLLDFSPDIIHINSPCSLGYYAVKFGRKYGIPVAATYHTHFPSYAKYYKLKHLENLSWSYFRKIYNQCDIVFVPSKPILEELIQHSITTGQFLPHGIDTSLFNTKRSSPVWKNKIGAPEKKVILYAGRLVWEKDLKILAEIYSTINSLRNDAVFVLAGDGPIRKELEEMMPNALFLGKLNVHDLAEAYASSDLFLFPSTTETFGNVVLEAMACGLPAVCSNRGGASGSVYNGVNGYICGSGNTDDFIFKLNSLLDDENKIQSFGKHAAQFASKQSWASIFEKQIIAYNDVLSRRNILDYRAA